MTDGTFRGHWVDEVFRSSLISDSVRVALLAMARDMDDAGLVSVPRVELAERLGRGKARISERLTLAVDAGFLSRVSAGKKGSTAVYRGTLPKGSARPDPKTSERVRPSGPKDERKGPPVRTQSEHFGSGPQDAIEPERVRPSGPNTAKKGPDGGDANMYMGSSDSDLVHDVTGEGLFELSAASRRAPHKKPSRRRPETAVPADFAITDGLYGWAKARDLHVDLELETERFINHALQHDRRCRDWDAAWRNWMLTAQRFQDEDSGRPTSSGRRTSVENATGRGRGGARNTSERDEWTKGFKIGGQYR